jgi:hypothetical protein
MIGSDVAELSWLYAIPEDRPVIVVMQCLAQADSAALLNRITGRFPSGEVIFDPYSRFTYDWCPHYV